ncbi:MAG: glycosyltransferase family 2 protein [Solirubrobacterales bacterium]
MSSPERDDIHLVLPTYNRAEALRANLGSILALRDIAEVIVVDDGSTDDTLSACEEFEDGRLRVISHPVNRGVATARNTGVEAARGKWVLFGEDDCRFPIDYASALRAEAERLEADIVGAPILHAGTEDSQLPQIAAAAARRERPAMEDVGVFPVAAIETPFLTALALVRRSVFERVRFHEDFAVNGYREETDFFVQAARAGFRCVLTPATYAYQLQTWGGGQHQSSTLRYEYWALRNNWRFLRRHGAWLAEHGYIPGVLRAQLRFARLRGGALLLGASRARLQRLRASLGARIGRQRSGSRRSAG